MSFLFLIGALGLVLLILDRLVSLPWWAQLLSLAGVATALVALTAGNYWSIPAAIYFAVLSGTVQQGTLEYMRAASLTTARRKSARPQLPW